MDQEDSLLGSLLAVATDELNDGECLETQTVLNSSSMSTSHLETKAKRILNETDLFKLETNLKVPLAIKSSSLIHGGDTDSSDDEGNRNYEEQKYNQCGREIKNLLNSNTALDSNSISSTHYGVPKKRVSTWKNSKNTTSSTNPIVTSDVTNGKSMFGKLPQIEKAYQDVFMDPIFGMRIVNPLISSSLLMERMQGRLAVRYSDLSGHLFSGTLKDKDWVICAVIVNKLPPKTTSKGSQYSIWTLSDLKDDIKTFSLFLFSGAHTGLWKTLVGTVIGILNPAIMDQKDGTKKEISLSVSNAQMIMIFGQSKDFGVCKSIKKNGDKCSAVVNLSRCEYCIYHIKQEYQKCSKRSELQANFAGQGLVNLRNKVLGKNEVFYAGKSYMAIPAKKSKKLEVRDKNILNSLDGMSSNNVKIKNRSKSKKGVARHLDVKPAQRARDLKLLEKLGGSTSLESKTNFSGKRSDQVTLEDSKMTALNVINKLKAKKGDVEEFKNKTNYDVKGDLFVNVDNKETFSGSVSEEISVGESRTKALTVISKLKAKKSENCGNNSSTSYIENLLSLEEIEDQLNSEELNYSDSENDLLTDLKSSIPINESISSTPKQTMPKRHIVESFGKISPNLSKTECNPNNLAEAKVPSTAKSIPRENSANKKELQSPKINKTPNSYVELTNNSPKTSVPLRNKINLNADTPKCQTPSGDASNPKKERKKEILDKSNTKLMNEHLDPNNMTMNIPTLSVFGKNNFIDLNKPITSRHIDRAKVNAIKFVQRHGPIMKVDPNSTKSLGSKKRKLEDTLDLKNDNVSDNASFNQNSGKKSKLQESEFISDRFKKMMAMTSKYAGLLEQHDNEEKEKYFKKLEMKEQMEEKMANTHKVKCKAVRCLQCKYTSFSASELCKTERHPLKVFDAMKRFYQCSNCQNRTVTLELIPTRPCNNCGSSKWEKTGMMKEKVAVVQHNLSIRGGEQKFTNSVVTDANLDLLVPDD